VGDGGKGGSGERTGKTVPRVAFMLV